MTFFNYENLWLLALGNPKVMVKLFTNYVDKGEGKEVLDGENFVLNPQVVIQNPYRLTYQQRAEYLGICALRNYQHYRQSGNTDIRMEYVPEYISPKVITTHPLIQIKDNLIILQKEN